MSKAGRMAASNVLLLKRSGDKRQENALQEAFKVIYNQWFFKFPIVKKLSTKLKAYNFFVKTYLVFGVKPT